MDKKVVWGEPILTKKERKAGEYGSYKEFLVKANKVHEEQQKAQEYLQKALKPMLMLLEMRLSKGSPLIVRRPLEYSCSKFNPQSGSFVSAKDVVLPGTKLLLKSLDPHLREFVFIDGQGNEVAISYDEKNKLMTQTDIFETAQEYLEKVGE